ncbi:hypothetical protein [Acetobacter sp. LMG 32666]|uniref:hypothetical protein n=1 Tax=Acetobacter sp. LMG 32666 TaxID=2959295 RepID=UPI0030C8A4B6
MPKLFYLLAVGGLLTPAAHALANNAPSQGVQTARPHTKADTPDATDTLNARSLAQTQRAKAVEPEKSAAPPVLPDGTIARGTGVMAPELLEAPVYNPADRQ